MGHLAGAQSRHRVHIEWNIGIWPYLTRALRLVPDRLGGNLCIQRNCYDAAGCIRARSAIGTFFCTPHQRHPVFYYSEGTSISEQRRASHSKIETLFHKDILCIACSHGGSAGEFPKALRRCSRDHHSLSVVGMRISILDKRHPCAIQRSSTFPLILEPSWKWKRFL